MQKNASIAICYNKRMLLHQFLLLLVMPCLDQMLCVPGSPYVQSFSKR